MNVEAAKYQVPPAYRDAVAELLYHSQMIEAVLRVYLMDVYSAANTALHRYGMRFDVPDKYLNKKALGQLVELFSHHTTNDDLVKRLRAFIEHRNRAAHTAYVWGMVHGANRESIADAIEKTMVRINEASALLSEVIKETAKSKAAVNGEQELQSRLDAEWFEKYSDPGAQRDDEE
jgi:hypothetical protein